MASERDSIKDYTKAAFEVYEDGTCCWNNPDGSNEDLRAKTLKHFATTGFDLNSKADTSATEQNSLYRLTANATDWLGIGSLENMSHSQRQPVFELTAALSRGASAEEIGTIAQTMASNGLSGDAKISDCAKTLKGSSINGRNLMDAPVTTKHHKDSTFMQFFKTFMEHLLERISSEDYTSEVWSYPTLQAVLGEAVERQSSNANPSAVIWSLARANYVQSLYPQEDGSSHQANVTRLVQCFLRISANWEHGLQPEAWVAYAVKYFLSGMVSDVRLSWEQYWEECAKTDGTDLKQEDTWFTGTSAYSGGASALDPRFQ